MASIIVSSSFDPFTNLALENVLFERAVKKGTDCEPLLYLWRNSDVVVIGRFQNPWKECALKLMEKDGVLLMRRDTGGGAVFHDPQNICFSFIGQVCPDYRAKNSALVCSALARLGFETLACGRNDITLDGAKISGSAYREKNGVFLHHGTLLVGTDLSRLANYLTPDTKKLASKGIQSVRTRVTSLREIDAAVTAEKVVESLCTEYAEKYGAVFADFAEGETAEIKTEYERLKSWDWRFGRSPEFTHRIEGRFLWGGLEILLTVKNAKIAEIAVYTDALDFCWIEELHAVFIDTLYEPSSLISALKKRAQKLESQYPAAALMLSDISSLL